MSLEAQFNGPAVDAMPMAPPRAAASVAPTRLAPPDDWRPVNVVELWRFRELLYFLIWRDVKVRYKQTVMGAAWAVLQPAMMMAVFTIFFSKMAKVGSGDLPYPLFAYLGLVPWTFFATAVGNAGNSVVGSERLISKVYFPRLLIPFGSVGAAFVDFVIAFCLLVGMLLVYRVVPSPSVLMLPVILALIVMTAVGIGTLLAALNVVYRDFRHVIPFLLQLWMFATPTIYMQASANGRVTELVMTLNPMSGLVASFRAACCGNPLDWSHLWPAAVIAPLSMVAGCVVFRRMERDFADLI